MPSLRALPLAAGLAVALLLTGCSAGEHGASAEASAAPTSVPLPTDFPAAAVPLLPGMVLAAGHPGNVWSVWVVSTNLETDFASASKLLTDAGYTESAGTTTYGDFASPDYKVRVIASDDVTHGKSLAYTFTEVPKG